MASSPYPDKRRHEWVMKYRPDPDKGWQVVKLGKDPRLAGARPPKVPPQFVLDRHRHFSEIEYAAKHNIKSAPVRAEALAAYLETHFEAFSLARKGSSARSLRRHINRFLEFAAERGVASMQGCTRKVCREFLEARSVAVSHDTVKTEKRFLAPAWTRAVEDGIIDVNPWSGLKVPGKSTASDPVFWSSAEIAAIAAACTRPWQADLVMVLANTGLRISTALAMTWEWVNWGAGSITIPRAMAAKVEGIKTAYTLSINRVAREILERRRFVDPGDLVFPNPLRPGPVSYDTARGAISAAIKRAKVKRGTPHDLRHSCARLMMEANIPVNVVQAQLGHATIATTQRYVDVDSSSADKYMDDFGVGNVKE